MASPFFQPKRDLAIEPQGTGLERALSARDIADAIVFNRRMFRDPYSLKTVRNVIGVPQYPAVSDRELALGVALWQHSHGVAQDGRIGVVTLMLILEELQAEGAARDATLLRADFRGPTGPASRRLPDLDAAHCGCEPALRREIADSEEFILVYEACGADPAIRTGRQVESCVDRHFAALGVALSTAGTTSSSGATTVSASPGRCGPLLEQVARAHEQVHSVHVRELRQIHGGGRSFRQAFNDAQDWVDDEVTSRETDIATARWMLQVLDGVCGVGGGP